VDRRLRQIPQTVPNQHRTHLERTGPFSIGKAEYYRGYKLIDASLLFAPVGWIRTYLKGWTSYSENNPNYAAFYSPGFKECYVAGTLGSVTTVKIPYDPGNVIAIHNKIEPDMSYKE
jgi:hypothetical protein